jgi:hypothetical protein
MGCITKMRTLSRSCMAAALHTAGQAGRRAGSPALEPADRRAGSPALEPAGGRAGSPVLEPAGRRAGASVLERPSKRAGPTYVEPQRGGGSDGQSAGRVVPSGPAHARRAGPGGDPVRHTVEHARQR